MLELELPSPITTARLPISGAAVSVKRDDLIHPYVCGNKWRKLKGFVSAFLASDANAIVSCGGWHSNHLHATAYYCLEKRIPFYAVVPERGIEGSYCIDDIVEWGAELEIVPHKDYRLLQGDVTLQNSYAERYDAMFIPEGGNGEEAFLGVEELVSECLVYDFKYMCAAVGTGTTISFLRKYMPEDRKLIGLKLFREGGIDQNIRDLIGDPSGIKMLYNEEFPRYGKISRSVIEYLNRFHEVNSFRLDPIYTVKLFNAIDRLIDDGGLNPEDVLLYHSGGLQALRNVPS